MNIPIKSPEEIAKMRAGGKILAEVLERTMEKAVPGISTYELDRFAENIILERGGKPGFKGYQGFPATLCTAINEVIVHGIPKKNEFLKEGDLFTIDCGVIYEGLYTDAARSKLIGSCTQEKEKLISTAELALKRAKEKAVPGNHLNEISEIIGKTIEEAGFFVIKDLTGHGVGRCLHEPPIILNFPYKKSGPVLKPGMTLAIEPIFSAGTHNMITLNDKWTIVTDDGSASVQVEDTILITKNGCETLTKL